MIHNDKEFLTLVELLQFRAVDTPQQLAFTYLKEGIHEEAAYTYAELDNAARAIAATITVTTPFLQAGDRALLIYPPGLEFLAAFFGCLYAGVVPIPAPAPDAARFKRTFPRLRGIIEDASARLIMSTDTIFQTAVSAEPGSTPWLCTETVDLSQAATWQATAVGANDLAYLQYTSGSTSRPKGVMLTHANVLRNLALSKVSWAYTDDSVAVTWMPYFHDYGLVDGLLQPIYSGIPCYVLSPLTFVKRPQRWLEAIHRYRGTHTQAPNFAYELCLHKITPAQRDALDLRCLKVASNGAEPVREATFQRFVEYFSPCGFQAEAFYPAYGLAETTLLVTTKRHGVVMTACRVDAATLEREQRYLPAAVDAIARSVVSCGPPLGDLQLAIVDAQSKRRLAPGAVGEIWVSDPCVAQGYWGQAQDSKAIFDARLDNEADSPGFLRTGDLGFMHEGELYVTGRLKDLIIIAGVNHYPQDIEWTVQQCHPELRPDHCAAFSVEHNGVEGLVVVAEVNRPLEDWQPLFDAVRRAVSDGHELELLAFVALRKGGIFKTSSGKLQRSNCRTAYLDGSLSMFEQWQKRSPVEQQPTQQMTSAINSQAVISTERLVQWLIHALSARLEIPANKIDLHVPFASYGLSSRIGVELVGDLEQWLERDDLSPTLLWEYPTVASLSAHLGSDNQAAAANAVPALSASSSVVLNAPLAIVGMACRLPGADNPEEFWQMLIGKGEAISSLPAGRWEGSGAVIAEGVGPGKVTTLRAGFLQQVDRFDADLFGIGAREAEIMDPQQRMLLEVAWEAIERAGLSADDLAGSDTGVFVGISTDDYSAWQLGDAERISAYTGPAKALSIAANRISYQFDFQGPSMAIDTACSSSLVAIHQASHALRRGECSMALAGGVNLVLAPQMSIALSQAGMLAPDGRCKTFDAAADGYVRGEGCVLLVLKRLDDALRDGDTITAIIRGSAVNQDGRSNGLTAPNGLAQQRVVGMALAAAGVKGADIDYVEAHGTGTSLGDPIEVKSLQAVLTPGREQDRPLALGSVKANIGHLEAAAGAAGVLKTALCLWHGEMVPHPTLRELNPLFNMAAGAFVVPRERASWPKGRGLAGVSSFGFGGTNAHVVMETPPVLSTTSQPVSIPVQPERPLQQLAISARDQDGLRALAGRWQKVCDTTDADLGDLCFSANTGRARLPERLNLLAADRAGLKTALNDWLAGRTGDWQAGTANRQRAPRIGFLFTGQGSQYFGMGRELYRTEPGFRRDMDECDALLRDCIGQSLLELLYGDADSQVDAEAKLAQTELTQPALFAIEYSLARLWMSWGIAPHALLGHSIGEFVAAAIAGVFSLAEGLRLVSIRARLMQHAPGAGGMVAVVADETQCRAALIGLEDKVVIAVYNGPRNHVLSGQQTALDEAVARLVKQGVETHGLKVSHAFHSPLMEAARKDFAQAAAEISYHSANISIISNVSGNAAGAELATPAYWVDHLMSPVHFAQGLQSMRDAGVDVFIEIGPRPTLISLGQQSQDDAELLWLASLRPQVADSRLMQESLGALHLRGAQVDWRALNSAWPRRRVAVPVYPFQGRRYWLPAVSDRSAVQASPFPGKRISSPLLEQTLFENRYDGASFPLLAEHLVFGQVVVPGAAHLSLVVEATAGMHAAAMCSIRDVVFPQALIVPAPGARRVQLAIARQSGTDGSRPFNLISLADDDSDETNWEEHATGRVVFAESSNDADHASDDLTNLQSRCAQEITSNFYQDIWQSAIHLGPQFRWVSRVWRGAAGEVLARLDLPEEANAQAYRLHPGMLDSMLQVLTAAVSMEGDEALVPFSVEAFNYLAPAQGTQFWSHIQLRPDGDGAAKDEVQSDVTLFDGEGRKIAEARGFRARRLASRNLMREQSGGLEQSVYAMRWDEQDLPAAGVEGRWLVLGEQAEEVERLALAIEKNAKPETTQCVRALIGAAGSKHADEIFIQLDDAELTAAQLRALEKIEGVVYLTGATATTITAAGNITLDAAVQACARTLHLVQAIVGYGERAPRLVLVTSNANGLQTAPRSDQAAILGMVKVVRLEHPELACQLIDIVDTDTSASVIAKNNLDEKLVAILAHPDQADIALRAGRCLLPTLERSKQSAQEAGSLRADASYLVSGGLGALGLRLAEWLVERGARNLLLLGRHAPNETATARITAMQEQGVEVRTAALDVGDADALPDVLRMFDTQQGAAALPPLAGVFHLAGVLDDGMLLQQDAARLRNVMRPKLGGALNLHHALDQHPLDYFVCYSSVAALTGSMGQGSYAAANAALDALMAVRRAQGKPGTSIQWGPWAESGMAAAQAERDQQRFADYGIDPILPDAGMVLLGKMLMAEQRTLAVLPVHWPTYLGQLYGTSFPSMYREVGAAPIKSAPVQSAGAVLAGRLSGAAAPERRALIDSHLQEAVSAILGLTGKQVIGPRQRLFELGLDSLGAVELRNRLAAALGRSLRATLLFDYPTLAALADHIEHDVLGFAPESADDAVADEAAAENLDQLSDDELARMLAAELG